MRQVEKGRRPAVSGTPLRTGSIRRGVPAQTSQSETFGLLVIRTSKGRSDQPIEDARKQWQKALKDAGLPSRRLFHDLRRSAVRFLIRSGVDPAVAMKVSGHKTRSMLDRFRC